MVAFSRGILGAAIGLLSALSAEGALQWTIRPFQREGTSQNIWLTSVAFGQGKFLAVTREGETYSAPADDPHTWTRGPDIPDVDLNTLIFADGKFAAVGLDTKMTNALFLSSADGVLWTRQPLENSRILTDVAYGNGRFVTVGLEGFLAHSTNGLDWISVTNFLRDPPALFQTLDFVNGEFMAAFVERGTSIIWPMTLALSTNGTDWQENGPWVPGFRHVAYGRRIYVGLGQNDCVPCGSEYFSADGRTWESRPFPGDVNGLAIAYANGVFAVSGWGTPSALLTSTNGVTWDEFRIGQHDFLGAMTYGERRFVAVGNGLIAVSDLVGAMPYLSNLRLNANTAEFEFNAGDKTQWQVELSDDLVEWRVTGEIEGNLDGRQTVSVAMNGKQAQFVRMRER
jgi:hypothetical protein